MNITVRGFCFMDVDEAHREEVLRQLGSEVSSERPSEDGGGFLFERPRGSMLEMLVHLRHVLSEGGYDLVDDLARYDDG